MSIHALEQSKKLREEGKRLKRAGLAERVLILVDEFNQNRSYKNAIVLAGKLKAIAQACKFDSYWDEKCSIGYHDEARDLTLVDENGKLPEGRESWWIK